MANEIFISYRRADEPTARLLYNLLKDRGVEAWYDAKIEAGEDWRTTTARALDAAPIFVLLLSRLATESGDIAKELAAATHKQKLVVPVRLDDMQLEGMFLYELASRNWIDAHKNTEVKLAELADKLATLVKAGLSPEAAKALDMNVAEIQAAKAARGGKAAKGGSRDEASGEKRKRGSVALITAGVAAIIAAATGGTAWYFVNSSGSGAKAYADGAASGEAASAVPAAPAVPAPPKPAPKLGPAATLAALAADAKAAGRSEAEVAALTEASGKLAALADKAKAGDDAAKTQATGELNDTALAAARAQIAALAADPAIASVRNDLKSIAAEQKASGFKPDAALQKTLEDGAAAQASLKAAVDATAATVTPAPDGETALAAAVSAQQAYGVLVGLQPAVSDAFLKAKRQSYAANSAAARSAAGQIAQLTAAAKKPNVFDSKERKEAWKYVSATDAWARTRMAAVDVAAAPAANADRKALVKYAAEAATARTELEGALVHVKESAARLN